MKPLEALRVLHVGKDFSGTGAPQVARQILDRLPFAYKAYAADPSGDSRPSFIHALRSAGIEPLEVSGLGNRTAYRLPLAVAGLIKLVRENQIDLIHSHTFVAGICARIAARFSGIPAVHTVHNLPSNHRTTLRRLIITLERALISISAVVTFVNAGHRRLIVGTKQFGTTRWIPNMIDLTLGKPQRTSVRKVLFMGRFDFQKNPELFVRIAVEADLRKLPLSFRMVGGGPLRQAVEALSTAQSAPIDVRGFSDSPEEQYAWADCLLVTSRYEAFGLVIAEALANGCHVISGDVDGLPEVYGDAVRFVKEGDLNEYCNALAELANDSNPRRGKIPDGLTEGDFVRNYRNLYECVMASR